MAQIFPDSLREFWSNWEIRVLVLVSLILQTTLILIGNRRKYSTGNFLRFLIWSTYLSADWIATVSLSVLMSSTSGDLNKAIESPTNPGFAITSFWAPFLLLHLGGPDNVTAYSLEDNELWWRHCVTLVVQVAVALYVFLRAWTTGNIAVNLLSVPIFFAGVIKLAERTWVRRCASSKYFRKRMFPRADPGPNYARYMEEYRTKELEGYRVKSDDMNAKASGSTTVGNGHTNDTSDHHDPEAAADNNNSDRVEEKYLLGEAYAFFKTFRRLFADLILGIQDIENSYSFFKMSSHRVVFRVIEIELGFIYDVFYTKADFIYSLSGGICRVLSFLLTVVGFVSFLSIDKQAYPRVDVSITYVLLVGAIALEIYAAVMLLSSDWTRHWLSKHKNPVVLNLYRAISFFSPPERERWSNYIAQYNLISFSLKNEPSKWSFLQRALCIRQTMEKHRYKTFHGVKEELKELIFQQLRQKTRTNTTHVNSSFGVSKDLCAKRGQGVLEKEGFLVKFGWSIEQAEFDQSILLWHIATDLCYHDESTVPLDPTENSNFQPNDAKENSKLLSDYMLYLLVMRPFMLPGGIGQIRFQDTCAEATEFFQERESIKFPENACEELLQVSTKIPPLEVKGDRSKSVLFDACRLAKDLQTLEREKRWELVSHVWVEMLSYAASQCQTDQHAQQLRKGGELITHVWLLMAHLGITEQFQITKGYARAKLIVE